MLRIIAAVTIQTFLSSGIAWADMRQSDTLAPTVHLEINAVRAAFMPGNEEMILAARHDGETPSILESAKIHYQAAAEMIGLDPVFVDESINEKGFLSRKVHDLLVASRLKEPRNILLDPNRVTTVTFKIPMPDGKKIKVWGFRVSQSDALGPSKGGFRWLLVHGETLEEAKATAAGLATLMTVKNAVIGIPYGGGKGDVVIEDKVNNVISGYEKEAKGLKDKAEKLRRFSQAIGQEIEDRKGFIDSLGRDIQEVLLEALGELMHYTSTGEDTGLREFLNQEIKKILQESADYAEKADTLKAYIVRGFARELTKKGAVGPYIDVPAPDVGTGADMMAVFVDEYLRIQARSRKIDDKRMERGLLKVKSKNSEDPLETPYLNYYLRLKRADMFGILDASELGVITGKPVEKGGSKGRTKATGFGGFLALRSMLNHFPQLIDVSSDAVGRQLSARAKALFSKDIREMTMGVQGGGNVGEYYACSINTAGAQLNLWQDHTGTLYNPQGIPLEELMEVLGKKSDDRLYEFSTVSQDFLDRTGTQFLKGSVAETDFSRITSDAKELLANLIENGYVSKKGGKVTLKFRQLKNASELVIDERFGDYQDWVYQILQQEEEKQSLFWKVHTNVKVPAAIENQITIANAADVNCDILLELANNPTTPEADPILRNKGILIIPDILANVGGVTVSYFEWLQNIEGKAWEETSVDKMLEERIESETITVLEIAKKYKTDLRQAAFILSMARVIDAEIARSPRLQRIFSKTGRIPYRGYGELGLQPRTLEHLQQVCRENKLGELIRKNEEKHTQEIGRIVDSIDEEFSPGKRGFVLVSGPTTSGKISFSKRVAQDLKEKGRKVKMIHIDMLLRQYTDFLQEEKELNQEEIYNARVIRMKDIIRRILDPDIKVLHVVVRKDGEFVRETITLENDDLYVIEGDYALSDEIAGKSGVLKDEQLYRVFVNTAPNFKLSGNRPLTSLDLRFMRHILSHVNLGRKVVDIVQQWPLRRNAQLAYTYTSWVNADVTFNSYSAYELPILKARLEPLLQRTLIGIADTNIRTEKNGDSAMAFQGVISRIRNLLSLLEGVPSVEMDDVIPSDSIRQQFIANIETVSHGDRTGMEHGYSFEVIEQAI
ncbi:MAG: Glu/Leu/Phe/Val dehydrogenase dimerization domain-containing protein [Candidatus Omnitrophota bacterium]